MIVEISSSDEVPSTTQNQINFNFLNLMSIISFSSSWFNPCNNTLGFNVTNII